VIVAGLAAGLAPASAEWFGMLDGSGYAGYLTLLFLGIALLVLLFAQRYAGARGFRGDEYYGLILFATLGVILVARATHWLVLFLGMELLSLSLVVLIAIRKEHSGGNEAGLKYFILGSVASAFLVFGIALVYAASGKMGIAASLGGEVPAGGHALMVAGVGFILVGIGFKTSLAPFHVWAPDVYQGAEAPVVAFLSTGSKLAVFSALLRIAVGCSDALWQNLWGGLWLMAALTMVVGNLSAVGQTHLKRLLAYSSVAHMGYLLMALLAVRETGVQAVLFYAAVYALMDVGAFGAVGTVSADDGDRDDLEDYRGLGYAQPWRAALLTTCLLSLAGLPPTAGLIGKFLLFKSAFQGGYVFLGLIGIVTAIISVYFYLKVVVRMYLAPAEVEPVSGPGAMLDGLAIGVVLVLIFGLGILPSPLLTIIAGLKPAL
jgi:NADH-quinone oxidoreductase subunit N